ncbi:MAG TPA: PIN domain-containing protein [Stellaceae bacterium]|nr:PIN domain-containing protein [Stellaceae bacterium]
MPYWTPPLYWRCCAASRAGERAREVLAGSAMTTVNLGEVAGHYARNGASEAEIRQVIEPLPINWIPFDAELAHAAGLLLPATRAAGLSFGDRARLALVARLGVPTLTTDRSWQAVGEAAGVEIELIRGGAG